MDSKQVEKTAADWLAKRDSGNWTFPLRATEEGHEIILTAGENLRYLKEGF